MSGGSVERVRAALLAAGHADSIAAFPDGTRSAAEAAAAVGCTVAQIAKSIVFRAATPEGDRPALVIASGANRVDMAKVSAVLMFHVKRADGAWVRDTTGFAIGGVAPLAHVTPPLVLLDADLFHHDRIWAAAGSPMHVFETTPEALLRLCGGTRADVREAA